MFMGTPHTPLSHLNDSSFPQTATNFTISYATGDQADPQHKCLYEETRLERNQFDENTGFYDLELFTHYLSGFGGISLAIIGLVINSFCAFTLCRAAVFRAHLVCLSGVAIANALQLSCLVVLNTRDVRQPDPKFLNLMPRLYIRAFIYLYPLSKLFHLTMAWFVMASTVDCWRFVHKAEVKEKKINLRLLKRRRSSGRSLAIYHRPEDVNELVKKDSTSNCRHIIAEILALVAITLLAVVYTIPAAWENKGGIMILGKLSSATNCSAFIYHLMPTILSKTSLYRIVYSLLGHLIFQTGIPLVVSSIAIASISRQLQRTSTSLGQLVTDAVNIVLQSPHTGVDRNRIPSATYSQRIVVENRNIIHCSLFLAIFTFYVCHVPQLWAKIQYSLMHVESHENSHMKYVNELVNFMTVANAAINGLFILCFCRRHIADGARDIEICAWCFAAPKERGTIWARRNSSDLSAAGDHRPANAAEPIYENNLADVVSIDPEIRRNTPEPTCQLPDPPLRSSLRKVQTPTASQTALNESCPPDRSQLRRPQKPHRKHAEFYTADDYEMDVQLVGSAGSVLPAPVYFQPMLQSHQQYFSMGPDDNDVYVAAEV